MRKIFYSLSLLLLSTTAIFFSCDDPAVVGEMKFTLDGIDAKIPTAFFHTEGDKTIITAIGLGHNVCIIVDGKMVDTYKMGFGKDAQEAAEKIVKGDLDKLSNSIVYKPVIDGNTADIQTSVFGSLTISEISDKTIKGSFSARLTDLNTLRNLDLTAIMAILTGNKSKRMEGTFTAVTKTI